MANTGTAGLLGVAYWLLAARLYPVASVGRASAAYAAMSLLAGFTAFNFTGALTRFIPQAGHTTRALVLVAYLVSTAASVLVTVPFLLIVRHRGGSYAELSSLAAGLAFGVCVVAWSLFTMQDGVLVGLRSAVWVPVENVAFGLMKILLLVVLAVALPSTGIYISWMLPAIAAVPLINFLIFSKLVPRHTAMTDTRVPPTPRQIARFVAGDYIGSLCVLITGNVVPVIVAIRVDPGLTAYFYMAWMIAGTVGLLAINMAASLTVEGAFDSASLAANCRVALHRMGLIMVPVVAAMALLSSWALSLFGPGYAANSTRILQLLAISTLPSAVTEVYLGALRAQSRASLIAFIQIFRCVLILGLTLTLIAIMGITGAGWAALVSQVIVAAMIVPGLRRVIINRQAAPVSAAASLPDHRIPASPARGDLELSTPRTATLRAGELHETETTSQSDDDASSSKRISVVICAYSEERWEQILAAVDSVRAQSLRCDQLIVVVDHNQALLAPLAAALPDVTVTENMATPGLSGARNTGIALSRGEIIAFLDDDAVAEPDWLKFLSDSYTDHAIAGVGGLAKPRWETRRPPWFPDEFDWVVGCAYRGTPRSRIPVRNLMGSNMSFRREIFETVHGFEEGIGRTAGKRPLGCEETELCIRIRQIRPALVLVSDNRAMVHHMVPAARCKFSYFRSRCFAEGLSKARVTAMVGAEAGLSVERGYVRRVLPRGFARGLADALHGDLWGLCRAGAIIAGLAATAAGYAAGRLRGSKEPGSARASSSPDIGREATVTDSPSSGSETTARKPLRWTARTDDVLDLLSGFMTACLLAVFYAGWSGWPRTLLALAFTFFVPGRAIITNWGGMTPSPKFGLSMVLSLGVLTLLATMGLWTHAWYPLTLFQIGAWLSLFGLSVGIIRRRVNWLVLEKEKP